MEKSIGEKRRSSVHRPSVDDGCESLLPKSDGAEIIKAMERMEIAIHSQNATIGDLRDTVHSQNATISDLRGSINGLQATVSNQNATIIDLRSIVVKQDGMIGSLNEEIITLNVTLKNKEEVIGKLEAKVDTLKSDLSILTRRSPSSEKGRYGSGDDGFGSSGQPGGGGGNNNPPNSNSSDSGAPSAKGCNQKKYQEQLKRLSGTGIKSGKDYRIPWERQEFLRSIGSDCGLLPPAEGFQNNAVCEESIVEAPVTLRFSEMERLELFGQIRGLHSSYDEVVRWNLQLIAAQTHYRHETLTNFSTGVSQRKQSTVGPPGTRLTWQALDIINQLHHRFNLPISRIESIIGIPYFSSSNISRWLMLEIEREELIYCRLGSELSGCSYFNMDDTNTLVIAMREAAKSVYFKADADLTGEELERRNGELHPLVAKMAELFGRVSQYADGEGGKRKVNLTVIIGQTDPKDSRSTIIFYRTHFGQAGNLLSRILENRSRGDKHESIFIQGDSSAQNHVEKKVAGQFKLTYVGCMHHARRPFKRYKSKDEELCSYLLRAFAIISSIERRILADKVTEIRILQLRAKAHYVWEIIKRVAGA